MEPAVTPPPHIVGAGAAGTPLTLFRWGRGIYDVRYMVQNIMTADEVETARKTGYNPSNFFTFKDAVSALKDRLKDAEPGIYWASNPLGPTYGKWSMALVAAGFTQVPGCALNRVYFHAWTWKGGVYPHSYIERSQPWSSKDGCDKWTHAFYYIKPGRKEPIEFDFSMRNLKATTGDDHNSLWQHGYGGRNHPPTGSGYGPGDAKYFLPNFARLSKNCGMAMGWGLPESGKWLDEEFFTIASLHKGKAFPEGWTPFLTYRGITFAHNLSKLDTSQVPCPHMEALASLKL